MLLACCKRCACMPSLRHRQQNARAPRSSSIITVYDLGSWESGLIRPLGRRVCVARRVAGSNPALPASSIITCSCNAYVVPVICGSLPVRTRIRPCQGRDAGSNPVFRSIIYERQYAKGIEPHTVWHGSPHMCARYVPHCHENKVGFVPCWERHNMLN